MKKSQFVTTDPFTIVVRHYKERIKKCSLFGLESREDIKFYTFPMKEVPDMRGRVVLTLDAPPLTREEEYKGLVLLDATWRYAEKMFHAVTDQPGLIFRSVPSHWRTAYPRRQTDCTDPTRGLASVEALYAAYQTLGRDVKGLLDHYYWKERFLTLNENSSLPSIAF